MDNTWFGLFIYSRNKVLLKSPVTKKMVPLVPLPGIVLSSQKSEAVVWRCSVKSLLSKISQYSQENNGAGVSF